MERRPPKKWQRIDNEHTRSEGKKKSVQLFR